MPATLTSCFACGGGVDDGGGFVYLDRGTVRCLYCRPCLETKVAYCDRCERGVPSQAVHEVRGGSEVCEYCLGCDYVRCVGCDEYVLARQAGFRGGRYHCSNCHPTYPTFPMGTFTGDGRFGNLGSYRRYGVELETSRCPGSQVLRGSAWGAKLDCTITGLEFVSPVLEGDAGFDVIREFAKAAAAHRWAVDDDCGFHLHLDLRDNTCEEQFAIAYAFRATEGIWFSFVKPHRGGDSGYSPPCEWSTTDLDRFYSRGGCFSAWGDHWERYNWINCFAYLCHGSLEIRNHEGTCDGEAICNWVKACARFADWAARTGYARVRSILDGKTARERFEVITEAWKDDTTLATYYADKARREHGVDYTG